MSQHERLALAVASWRFDTAHAYQCTGVVYQDTRWVSMGSLALCRAQKGLFPGYS